MAIRLDNCLLERLRERAGRQSSPSPLCQPAPSIPPPLSPEPPSSRASLPMASSHFNTTESMQLERTRFTPAERGAETLHLLQSGWSHPVPLSYSAQSKVISHRGVLMSHTSAVSFPSGRILLKGTVRY